MTCISSLLQSVRYSFNICFKNKPISTHSLWHGMCFCLILKTWKLIVSRIQFICVVIMGCSICWSFSFQFIIKIKNKNKTKKKTKTKNWLSLHFFFFFLENRINSLWRNYSTPILWFVKCTTAAGASAGASAGAASNMKCQHFIEFFFHIVFVILSCCCCYCIL